MASWKDIDLSVYGINQWAMKSWEYERILRDWGEEPDTTHKGEPNGIYRIAIVRQLKTIAFREQNGILPEYLSVYGINKTTPTEELEQILRDWGEEPNMDFKYERTQMHRMLLIRDLIMIAMSDEQNWQNIPAAVQP